MRRRAFLSLALAGCVPRPREERSAPAIDPAVGSRSRRDRPAAAGEASAPDADPLEQRARELRHRYGARGYTVLVEDPCIVVGDESPQRVQRHAEGTIRWAISRLRKDYFDRDPLELLEVWLFGDETSYRRGARAIFGDDPDTPYGYYSPRHGALIMNIGSGGGTLVHELVHPFMAANFEACPAWFNEGLASLYEQCADHDGHIWGLPNWRLPGLQRALRNGEVPPFAELCATDDEAFYEADPGTNYAQARYLCLWLQEHGHLVDYYRTFKKAAATDPTGYTTLKKTIPYDDMQTFRRDWESFTLALRFE